jgi:ABC-type hemin transport system substrate-binding protein
MIVCGRWLQSVLLALALVACKGAAPSQTSNDVLRVVSMLPNATEILFALGAGPMVVGATRYCDRPDAARLVPRVGGILDISSEAVLAAHPDVVVGSPVVLRGQLAKLLEASGVRILPLVFETASDVEPGIRALGIAVNRLPQADALALSYRNDLSALTNRALREPRVKVLLVVGRNPLVVASRSSYLGDLLVRMGVENVAASMATSYPTWSLEQVIQAAPDVIIDGAVEAGDLVSLMEDAGMQAAREGRMLRIEDPALLRPGPSTGGAALALADRILGVVAAGPTRIHRLQTDE